MGLGILILLVVSEPNAGKRLPNPPIFIVGHARSGTTWLFDIVSSHPEVAGVFETWMFTQSNGFAPLLKAHWGDGMLATRESVIGRHPGLGQLITREEAFETVRSISLDWLGRALDDGQRFVLEKGPMDYDVVDELFPDARYIHIMRDGRDVAVSMHEASRSWAPEMLPHVGSSLTGSAALWEEELTRIRRFGARVPNRFFELRYEDLRADPLPLARRVFEFCGIPCTDEQLEAILAETSFDAKKRADTSGFVRKGTVGGWRARFGIVDALRVHHDAGAMLLETGYATSRWWWLRYAGARVRSLGSRARASAQP